MILFLDYDGVLHPDEAFLVKGRPMLRAEGELFMWAPILADICAPHPRLQIVLSTSWVRMLGFNRARAFLPDDLSRRVIGATWHTAMARHAEGSHRMENSWFTEASRYEQIARYVSRAGQRAAHWVAIDDDGMGWKECLLGRLVETDPNLGLSSLAKQCELSQKLRKLADGEL